MLVNYHNITHIDQNNGDGLRVTLWLSGCSHHCKGCQNNQTWNPISGIEFDEYAKKELFKALDNDYISGITFSGGDPLHENNLDEVLKLILEIRFKFPNKTIWLYTGYVVDFYEVYNSDHTEIEIFPKDNNTKNDLKRLEIISKCDVLVDGKYVDELRNVALKWRGSSNQRVINVQESLRQNEVILHCD